MSDFSIKSISYCKNLKKLIFQEIPSFLLNSVFCNYFKELSNLEEFYGGYSKGIDDTFLEYLSQCVNLQNVDKREFYITSHYF